MNSEYALKLMKEAETKISKVHVMDYCGLSLIKEVKEDAKEIAEKFKDGCGKKFKDPIRHTYQYGDNHLIPAICKKVNGQRKESEYLEILCPNCKKIKEIWERIE